MNYRNKSILMKKIRPTSYKYDNTYCGYLLVGEVLYLISQGYKLTSSSQTMLEYNLESYKNGFNSSTWYYFTCPRSPN